MPSSRFRGAEDLEKRIQSEEVEPSTFETIDQAFYNFVNDKMNNYAFKNTGWEKTPVIWTSAERAFLSKNNKELRDSDGSLILPIITIERTSVAKSLTRKGKFYGLSINHPDTNRFGRITIARKIVKDKTNNFAVAENRKIYESVTRNRGRQSHYPRKKNEKVVYETYNIPLPNYVSINYKVSIKSNFQEQMNDLVTPFVTLGSSINYFVIKNNSHRYETFLNEDIPLENNISNIGTEERLYETVINYEVLGYLIGEAPNGERQKIVKRENFVEIKFPREKVIFNDTPDYGNGGSSYRE